jgi:hypothetical protein
MILPCGCYWRSNTSISSTQDNQNLLTILTMNCRSFRSEAKRNEPNTMIETHQPHIVFMSSTWLFIIGVGWHVWPLCNVWFIVSFCLHFGHDHIMLSHLHILLYSTGLMLPHLMWTQCTIICLPRKSHHKLLSTDECKVTFYVDAMSWRDITPSLCLHLR